jgi:hypothetical protein
MAGRDLKTISVDDRKAIGQAIIDGLISPVALTFERLATEGGDYNQTQGDYTQSGGGDHNQGGGGYNQSAIVRPDTLNIVTLAEMVKGVRRG